MKKINIDLWEPVDGIELENNAFNIVKTSENSLVVAGPGAGKTELLAQKACYLLQTNSCPFPYKILAISFKKDAAYNLKERVRQRCGDELSQRFESLTFDSFAKKILDRFKKALPQTFKINNKYKILLSDKDITDYYRRINIDYLNTTQDEIILKSHHSQLPHDINPTGDIRNEIWKEMLSADPSELSFKMIMRLAEYIIKANPMIRHNLQQTYKHIFLDEFQDTTEIQYDFFKTCFLGSDSIFTAVGDDKQRIMLWAGAQSNIFNDFLTDTKATRVSLSMNFRCAPKLVKLLNHLTEHLLKKEDFSQFSSKWNANQGECLVWRFSHYEEEINYLFQQVQEWITTDKKLNLRDICILVKQQLPIYTGKLIDYFNKNGIKSRDESQFQDILTQDICLYIINILYCIFKIESQKSRKFCFDFLRKTHNELEDTKLLILESKLSKFIKKIKKTYPISELKNTHIKSIISEAINLANKEHIKATFLSYSNERDFEYYIKIVESEIIKNFDIYTNIITALDTVTGIDTIPVMTIHKSKGLEYHTIIFIGLEDGAFWSFQRQPDEDKCAFFVALSRAKERVVFTFSKYREGRRGIERQNNNIVKVFFDELEKAGIVSREIQSS